MKQILARVGWIFFLLLTLVACDTAPDSVQVDNSHDHGTGRVLVLGDISDEAAETIEGTQPTADYLAARLDHFGITSAEVKIAPDLETMTQWMAEGVVDLYFDSPYPALVISQETGAVPILRRWKYGVSEYHSLFFTRSDSGLDSIADLHGNYVAFEEPFSTSGYMLPLAYLIERGLNPVRKGDMETAVSADEIGYVYSTADNTTIQWVVSRRVPVGVVDNITYERFIPAETRAELVVLGETESVPRQLVLVSPDMDEELQEAIKKILLEMDDTESGSTVLKTFLTTKFDEFPQGAEVALGRMRAIYQIVQER